MWDELAHREEMPARLVILGGGPIGTEMAQAFARLGSKVTQVEYGPRILLKEDEEVSDFVAGQLRQEGVDILTGHEAIGIEGKTLIARAAGGEVSIPFDDLILRSEEHTSELQSLMRISYAVFCLKKKKTNQTHTVIQ